MLRALSLVATAETRVLAANAVGRNCSRHSCKRYYIPFSPKKNASLSPASISRTFSTASLPAAEADNSKNNDKHPSEKNEDDTGGQMLGILLTPDERDLLAARKELVARARELAKEVGAVSLKDYSSAFLENLVDETTFSIVVAGEFNAGKSTLINALLGKKVLESGALPTTDSITILTQQKEDKQQNILQVEEGQEEKEVKEKDSVKKHNVSSTNGGGVIVHHISNVPLLEDLTFIDTPGTNAVLADHTARTLRLLPTADLILFVTSADRPFPESERVLLSSIQAYRKSIVVIVNKMDILETSGGSFGAGEKQRVVDFVTEHASELLGGRPMVIPVSSRDALSAKLNNTNTNLRRQQQNLPNNSVWERSNFATLESFLKDSLTMETRIKTKLTNPIGQAEGMVNASMTSLKKEKEELELDIATIKLLNSQYAAWKTEMDAQMLQFRQDVATLLQTEENRCDILLNRLGLFQFYSYAILNDAKNLEKEFDNTRPNFSSRQSLEVDLLEHVQETADSIATRGRAQGQAVIEFLGKRPAVKNQSLVGSVSAASRFEDTRKILADNLSSAVKTHVIIDESMEKQQLIQSLQRTALASAGLQMGALASGIATAAQLVDMMMGMGSCSLLAITGGMIYSQGRSSTGRGHRAAWVEREERLDEALQAICSKELSRVERRILDGVAPYTRFVETEKGRLERLMETSEDILAQAHALRNRIKKLR